MVYRLDARDCMCNVCNGGHRVPGLIGGSWCPCECHTLTGKACDEFIAAKVSTLERAIKDALNRASGTRAEGT